MKLFILGLVVLDTLNDNFWLLELKYLYLRNSGSKIQPLSTSGSSWAQKGSLENGPSLNNLFDFEVKVAGVFSETEVLGECWDNLLESLRVRRLLAEATDLSSSDLSSLALPETSSLIFKSRLQRFQNNTSLALPSKEHQLGAQLCSKFTS